MQCALIGSFLFWIAIIVSVLLMIDISDCIFLEISFYSHNLLPCKSPFVHNTVGVLLRLTCS